MRSKRNDRVNGLTFVIVAASILWATLYYYAVGPWLSENDMSLARGGLLVSGVVVLCFAAIITWRQVGVLKLWSIPVLIASGLFLAAFWFTAHR